MPNNIFIISGPSGAGEDSIINGLKERLPIERIITTTTRPMRPGEQPGRDYYFIEPEQFLKNIREKKFIEYAQEYNNHYYGATHEEIERVKKSGKVGIWKIEYKGVITVKKIMPDIKAIFINAPLDILAARIRKRGNVSEEFIQERLAYTQEWLKCLDIYDFTVNNEEGKLEQAIKEVANIIEKQLKRSG